MVLEASAVYDVACGYGSLRLLDAVDIEMTPRTQFKSTLVKMANEADATMLPEERQLYW